MAGDLGHGQITSLELGLRLFLVPAGLMTGLAIAPVTATWSARKELGGWPALRQSANTALMRAAAIAPPIVVLGFVLRRQLVTLAFQGGAYSPAALSHTTAVFGMILLALPAQLAIVVFSTLFVVQRDTIFPLKVACANVVLNVVLNFALRSVLGVAGIALSTSVTYTILLGVYVIGATRRWGSLMEGRLLATLGRTLASAVLLAGAATLLLAGFSAEHSRVAALTSIVVVGTVGVAIQFVLLIAGRDPFALHIASRLRRMTTRLAT
jgi:putative peptidoglycan lipid II flippase